MTIASRPSTLIAGRVIVVTLLLGSAILVELNRPGRLPVDPFFFLIGVTYALSVVYLLTLRVIERFNWLVDVQFAIDAVLVSAFIHVTGGIASNFSWLYLLPIIAASVMRHRSAAFQVAAFSAALYFTVVAVQYVDVGLPIAARFSPEVALPSLGIAQYTVAINLAGYLAVAALSGSLADSLRSAGAKLDSASHEIRDLRAFNDYVINSLLSGLVTTDGSGRILTYNRAAAEITGVPAAKATGQPVADVMQIPPDAREQLANLTGGRSLRVDTQYSTQDGRTIDIGLTISPLGFPAGHTGYLLLFQDVTDVRRLEREARLRQRLAAVGEMAAGIAHEIRNPLASMSGSIQVLREELPLTDEQTQLMDIVLRESARLNDTIKAFLAYARPQRSAMRQLDVGQVLRDTAVLLRNSAEVRSHHTIDVDTPAERVLCDADENQIRQVVWNLATNGLRAMEQGGRLLLAAGSQESADGQAWVVLTVQDEGRGIPAEEIEGVFQPFRSSFDRGTGLGLPIVHRIVTDYDGTIDVSSRVGIGTIVSVRLPSHVAARSLTSGQDALRSVPA
jgi:two-component system sensor histidine kinase PilS (NtrC family)